MTRRALTVALLVVTLLAVALLAVGGTVGSAGAMVGPADGNDRGLGTLAQPEANNTTVHHDNPETVDDTDDSTKAWLEAEFTRKLGESSIRVSQGEYEKARGLVDNDTKELLGKYVDVAGETDEETAEEFQEAQQNQREFVNETQEYEETYQEYQEARRNGNEQRARDLARDLERISKNATDSGTDLTRDLQGVSNRTGADLQDAETAVNETVQNISSRQTEVRENTFTPTSLVVETTAGTFSFRDPLPISGRLVAENGTAISNRTVRVRVGRTVRSVETDANGTFSFRYRPVLLPVDAEHVPVRYQPRDSSAFLGSAANVTASLEQSTPSIAVDVDRDSARFGDNVSITGQVDVDGTAVRRLPLVVAIDDQRLGTVRTNSDGRFSLEGEVPARVPAGEATVVARVAVANRSIEHASGSTTLQVETTATNLTASATTVDDVIRVEGRLTTADGRPLANKNVRIQVDGLTMTAVETDSEGRYVTTVRVPERVDRTERSSVNVTADFTWDGRNLGPARAETTAQLPRGQGFEVPGFQAIREFVEANPVAAGGIATFVVASLLGAGWVARRRREPDAEVPTDDEHRTDEPTATTSSRAATASLLTQARDRLAEDPQTAIRLGYAAVRERFGADETATHWEFYGDVSDDVDDQGTLRTLTETYEQAVFGHGVDTEEAEDAVESATTLTRGEPSPDGGPSSEAHPRS